MLCPSPPPTRLVCRPAMLPALYFEPVALPASAARAGAGTLALAPDGVALMVFPEGDVDDDDAIVELGSALNAWPNAARRRSLPLLPALRLTGVGGRSRDELVATADAMLIAERLERRFAYDTVIVAADGAVSAVFWTVRSKSPGSDAPSGRRQRSWRSHHACRQTPCERR